MSGTVPGVRCWATSIRKLFSRFFENATRHLTPGTRQLLCGFDRNVINCYDFCESFWSLDG